MLRVSRILLAAPEVYHGTTYQGFTSLDPTYGELGTHYGPKDVAEQFRGGREQSRLFKHFVEDEHMLPMEDQGDWTPRRMYPKLVQKGAIEPSEELEATCKKDFKTGEKALREALLAKGYQGIVYLNRFEGFTPGDNQRRANEGFSNRTDLSDEEFLKLYPSAKVCYIVFTPSGELVEHSLPARVAKFGKASTLLQRRLHEASPAPCAPTAEGRTPGGRRGSAGIHAGGSRYSLAQPSQDSRYPGRGATGDLPGGARHFQRRSFTLAARNSGPVRWISKGYVSAWRMFAAKATASPQVAQLKGQFVGFYVSKPAWKLDGLLIRKSEDGTQWDFCFVPRDTVLSRGGVTLKPWTPPAGYGEVEPKVAAFDRKQDWLERHKVPVENGRVTLYHATPKDTAAAIELSGLRAESLFEFTPERAVFQARRDRELSPKAIVCFEVKLPVEWLRCGVFPGTTEAVPPEYLRQVRFNVKEASVRVSSLERSVSDDVFLHFTSRANADLIIQEGKLKDSGNGRGAAGIFAVSEIWGNYVPQVQVPAGTTDLVAVRFTTTVPPDYGYVEEVIWHQDVILQEAKIIPAMQAAKRLLQNPKMDDSIRVNYA